MIWKNAQNDLEVEADCRTEAVIKMNKIFIQLKIDVIGMGKVYLKYEVDRDTDGIACSCGNQTFKHRHTNWIECTSCNKIKVLK